MSLGSAYVELGVKDNGTSAAIGKLGNLIEKLEGNVKTLSGGFNAMNAKTDALGSKLSGLGKVATGLQSAFFALGGIVVFKNLSQEVGKFQASLITAKNVASGDFGGNLKDPALAKNISAMESGLKKLSNETGQSRQALGEASVSALKLGISIKSGTEDVLKFVEGVTKMQTLQPDFAGGSADEAANKIAKLNNVLGNSTGNTLSLISSISSVSDASTASADGISELILRFGSFGKQVGATQPELLGLAGTLIDVGLTSEVSGTAINDFFAKTKTNGQDFINVIGKINPAVKETFQKQIATNGVQALKTFATELGKMSVDQATAVLDKLKLTGSGTLRTMLGLAQGTKSVGGELSIFEKNINAAKVGFENLDAFNQKYLATLDGDNAKFAFFGNIIKNLGLDIVGGLLPAMTSLVSLLSTLANSEGFQGFMDQFTTGIKSVADIIITYVVPAFGYMLSVIGPVIQNIVAKIGEVGRALFQIFGGGDGDIVGKAKSIFESVANAVNGLVNVVAGIAKLVAGRFKFMWDSSFKYAVDALSGVIKFVEGVINILQGNFSVGFGQILSGIGQFVVGAVKAFRGLLQAIENDISMMAEGFSILFIGVLRTAGAFLLDLQVGFLTGLGRILKYVTNLAKNIALSFLNLDITPGLSGMITDIKNRGNKILSFLGRMATKVVNTIKGWFSGDAIAPDPEDMTAVVKSVIGGAITDIGNGIDGGDIFKFTNTKASISKLGSEMGALMKPVTDTLGAGVKKATETGKEGMDSLGQSASSTAGEIAATSDNAKGLNENLDKTKKSGGGAKDVMKGLGDSFKEGSKNLSSLVDKLASSMDKFKNSIKETMKNLEDGIQKSKDKIIEVNTELSKSVGLSKQKFAEDIVGDQTKVLKEVDSLQGKLESIKTFNPGVDLYDTGFMELVNKLLDAKSEKDKAIIEGQIENFKATREINGETEKYLDTLKQLAEKKKELASIDDVINRNVAGSGIDLAEIQKKASLEGAAKREADYIDEIGKLKSTAAEKIATEQELINIQQQFQDQLLAKKFFNERQYQNFRKEILANELLSTGGKDEALKLAEKFKALGDEKKEIQKTNSEILTIKEDLAKKEVELSDAKNSKVRDALSKEIADVKSTITEYEKLNSLREGAFGKGVQSIKGTDLAKNITSGGAETSKTGEQELAVLKEQNRVTDLEKTTANIEAVKQIKTADREEENLLVTTHLESIRSKHTEVNLSIRSIQRSTTDQAIANMYREMAVVSQQIQSYYQLAAAKRAAGAGGFFSGGFTGGNIPGFLSGGFTGLGNIRDVAGVVHKGEYVIPANVLKRLAPTGMLGMLEKMRKGFMIGGFTSPVSGISNSSSSQMIINQEISGYRSAEAALAEISYLYRRNK